MSILKILLDKNPDLTIKNKKGQTPIDITNSKTIITVFSEYLCKHEDSKNDSKPKKNIVMKTVPKFSIPSTKPKPKPHNNRGIKDSTDSETKSGTVFLSNCRIPLTVVKFQNMQKGLS